MSVSVNEDQRPTVGHSVNKKWRWTCPDCGEQGPANTPEDLTAGNTHAAKHTTGPFDRMPQLHITEVVPPWDNLNRANAIVDQIDRCRRIQGALKTAFKQQILDGGWTAALDHPLHKMASARILELEDELRRLI